MVYFEVTLTGDQYNLKDYPSLSGVRLAVFTIDEHQAYLDKINDAYMEMVTSFDYTLYGPVINEVFFQHNVSCLMAHSNFFLNNYKLANASGVSLDAKCGNAALLEARNLLPLNSPLNVQYGNGEHVTVHFKNGSTATLNQLGFHAQSSPSLFVLSLDSLTNPTKGYVSNSPGIYSRNSEETYTLVYNAFDGRYSIWDIYNSPPQQVTSLQELTSAELARWVTILQNETPGIVDTDPYSGGGGGGGSEPGGGGGNHDGTSDPVTYPNMPNTGATQTGFLTLYNPSVQELNNLANYLWNTSLFDPSNLQKLFSDPMEAILGLAMVPVNVPSTLSTNVKVGNIDTGISMSRVSAQFVEVDCGSVTVEEFWGAYLDYDPYTKAELYLPYIGTRPISIDDIMGKSVEVKYHIDLVSGACCAYVKCGDSILYTYTGQCSCSIPVTGRDMTNIINGALQIAGAIGSMVATGGATAPMAIGTLASASVNVMKQNIEKSGAMGGMGGLLGIQTPYLILTRPQQAVPSNQNEFTGYPSFINEVLGALTGYTEVFSVHLHDVPCTEAERNEIETLLKEGVIL